MNLNGTEVAEDRLNVLIVDDEVNIRRVLAVCLETRGHRVSAVGRVPDALAEAGRQAFDLAFVDLRLGADNGLDLIPRLLGESPWLKIVVITAYASIETAVEAMRRGAVDYIPKPFVPEQVLLVADRVGALRRMERRLSALQDDLRRANPEVSFQTRNPDMARAVESARQVASSEAVVLLRGPSGTGKSVLARAIHSWSPRRDKPLGVISCPSLSPELLESELFGHAKGAFTGAVRDNSGRIAACEGGTLLLDEIGDLPMSIQPKLLRFLQDREYERVGEASLRRADVRIIAATNADLGTAVGRGAFREDLYYRLNVFPIELPPLRERAEDIELLAADMLAFFAGQNHKPGLAFTAEALAALRSYAWPGNIRELRNAVERAVILCPGGRVGLEHLPAGLVPRAPALHIGAPISLERIEEAHIRGVIAASRSLQEASEILGIDQATLWRKRKLYGLD
ncbi:MAG: sigma-54 dependent transcriptional regulator [Acidobacteriota bacterium]|nr:sigma-54 dependent transcriptional regulator [Acidobacteriota bacterium]